MDGVNRQSHEPRQYYKRVKRVKRCRQCGKITQSGLRVIAKGDLCHACEAFLEAAAHWQMPGVA